MKKLTKKQMIEALVEDMDNWDLESLVEWAQDARRNMLKSVDFDEVEDEYRELLCDEER